MSVSALGGQTLHSAAAIDASIGDFSTPTVDSGVVPNITDLILVYHHIQKQ